MTEKQDLAQDDLELFTSKAGYSQQTLHTVRGCLEGVQPTVDQLTELARDRASAFQEYEFRQAECGDYSLWTPLSLYQREQTLWDETIAHSNAAEHPYNWTMMDQALRGQIISSSEDVRGGEEQSTQEVTEKPPRDYEQEDLGYKSAVEM